MIGELERKRVGLEARPKGSSHLLLGMCSHDKIVMASHRHAAKKTKKFLEIWLPITVEVLFLHDVVLLAHHEDSQFCIHEA